MEPLLKRIGHRLGLDESLSDSILMQREREHQSRQQDYVSTSRKVRPYINTGLTKEQIRNSPYRVGLPQADSH